MDFEFLRPFLSQILYYKNEAKPVSGEERRKFNSQLKLAITQYKRLVKSKRSRDDSRREVAGV